jgi:hypothetical protein
MTEPVVADHDGFNPICLLVVLRQSLREAAAGISMTAL